MKMNTIITTKQYRLYPTKKQEEILNSWIEIQRLVYNSARHQMEWYERENDTDPHNRNILVDCYTQDKEIAYTKQKDGRIGLKNDPELVYITDIPRECLTNTLKDLELSFKMFMKGKGGYPTDREEDQGNSLEFQVWSGGKKRQNVTIGKDSTRFPKIGRIKHKKSKKIRGKMKTSSIVKRADGWFNCVVVEQQVPNYKHKNKEVGVDLGINKPIALSNGEFHLENIKEQDKDLNERIKESQRKMSKKTEGSSRYLKEQKRHQTLERKRAARRKARNHEITTKLAKENKFIVVEDLKVQNLTKKKGKQQSGRSREFLNVSPYMIREQLKYKAKKFNGHLIKVDPKYTSQDCNECGHRDRNNRREEAFKCTSCGHANHADVNAAKNILKRGSEEIALLRKTTTISSEAIGSQVSNGFRPALVDHSNLLEFQ